jgi:hypothetical protein
MSIRNGISVAAAAVCGFLAVATSGAQAVSLQPCTDATPDASGDLLVSGPTGASVLGCEVETDETFNVINNENGINALGLFPDALQPGEIWRLLAKDSGLDGSDEGPVPQALSITDTNGITGDWAVTSLADIVLLVFQDGAQADPGDTVFYLVDLAASVSFIFGNGATGTFTSMFENGNGVLQQISNVAVYRPGVEGELLPEVPLPPGVLLLLSALGVAVLSARLRRVRA